MFKKTFYLLAILCFQFVVAQQAQSKDNFGIVIHGGAGTILKKNMTPEMDQAYRKVLAEAIQVGHAILKAGVSSQEAVEKTIHVMEDSPLFNAGKGAVLTAKREGILGCVFHGWQNLKCRGNIGG